MKSNNQNIYKFILILTLVLFCSCSKESDEEQKDSVPTITLSILQVGSDAIYIDGVWFRFVSCTGTVENNGGSPITEYGFCWVTNGQDTPDIKNGEKLIIGTKDITGSSSKTEFPVQLYKNYHVRAYAINSFGVGYSEVKIANGGSISPR